VHSRSYQEKEKAEFWLKLAIRHGHIPDGVLVLSFSTEIEKPLADEIF